MELLDELVGERIIRHPAKSPDLNIIENLWAILDRKVKSAEITNIQTLKRFLRKRVEKFILAANSELCRQYAQEARTLFRKWRQSTYLLASLWEDSMHFCVFLPKK